MPYIAWLAIATVLFLAGIGLLVADRKLFDPGRLTDPGPMRQLMVIAAWVLVVVGMALGLSLTLGIFSAIAAPTVLAMVVGKRRVGQRYLLLSTLVLATERRMPLAPALEAFASETGGPLSRRSLRLAALLRAGCPLPEAIERVPGVVPAEAVATISVGCETGAIDEAMREALDDYESYEPLWDQMSGKFLYFSFLLAFGMLISAFLMLKIVPEFQKIFLDFGVELPHLTQAINTVARFLSNSFLFVPIAIFLVGLPCFYLTARFVGWGGWEMFSGLPLVRRYHVAPTLNALALIADRGMPFPRGIKLLADTYPAWPVRRRLQGVLVDIEAGGDWAVSLRRRGLIKATELAVLQAAERLGNLPWALREMAASSRRRLVYRLHGLLQVLFVFVICGFGLLVGLFVVAYFLPLIILIQQMT